MTEMLTQEVSTSAGEALEQLKKSYDAEVKNFLKEKDVLAIILKHCVVEFKDCALEDISSKYIEGTPQVACVVVDRDAVSEAEQELSGSKIAGLTTEDRSIQEGLVTYDIRFTAFAPATGAPIKLIINVEAQKESARQEYPIVKRALYYCARMISAQKNVEFTGMRYERIKKVYSIWICQACRKIAGVLSSPTISRNM